MKRTFIIAALLAAATTPALAGGKSHDAPQYGKHPMVSYTIVASCFRGPWKDVIWDRPNAVFIDTLVAAGYDYPTAHSIGERVCRDEALVHNPELMRAEAIRVLEAAPRYNR